MAGKKLQTAKITSGKCSDCLSYEARKTDRNGRAYCNHYGHYIARQSGRVVCRMKGENCGSNI